MATALELAPTVGMTRAADAFGVPRASLYRARRPAARAVASLRPAPPRALTPPERLAVLEVLHSARFVDQAPRRPCGGRRTAGPRGAAATRR
jgi:hypothetical protein